MQAYTHTLAARDGVKERREEMKKDTKNGERACGYILRNDFLSLDTFNK